LGKRLKGFGDAHWPQTRFNCRLEILRGVVNKEEWKLSVLELLAGTITVLLKTPTMLGSAFSGAVQSRTSSRLGFGFSIQLKGEER
jgi:hypothetical protein